MKSLLSILLVLCALTSRSQDSAKIKEIDALVLKINSSTLPVQRDSVSQDMAQMGYKSKTYITLIIDGKDLRKYQQEAIIVMTQNGSARTMHTETIFYYNGNKLIKAEDYLTEQERKKVADWYYANDKPFYRTFKGDNAEDRATQLLDLSKELVKKVIK